MEHYHDGLINGIANFHIHREILKYKFTQFEVLSVLSLNDLDLNEWNTNL